jgi:hypothetical protein
MSKLDRQRNFCAGVFLRSEGPCYQVRLSEGPVCRVRCATLDHLPCFGEYDKHARCNYLTINTVAPNGHEMRASLTGSDKRAPPFCS